MAHWRSCSPRSYSSRSVRMWVLDSFDSRMVFRAREDSRSDSSRIIFRYSRRSASGSSFYSSRQAKPLMEAMGVLNSCE